jgi:hypothetical protein
LLPCSSWRASSSRISRRPICRVPVALLTVLVEPAGVALPRPRPRSLLRLRAPHWPGSASGIGFGKPVLGFLPNARGLAAPPSLQRACRSRHGHYRGISFKQPPGRSTSTTGPSARCGRGQKDVRNFLTSQSERTRVRETIEQSFGEPERAHYSKPCLRSGLEWLAPYCRLADIV